jgi:excisionase family DNA binding protein
MDDTNGGAATQAPDVAFLTPQDIQRELRIGEQLCYKLLRAGSIPSVRVGHLYRVRREDLLEVLESGTILEVRQ